MGKKMMNARLFDERVETVFLMTEAFIRKAEALGHTVTRFDAAFRKLGGCHACETCYSKGRPCTFDDDFNTIAPAILEADVVVFSTPVYWYTIPAQIKCVIDRMFCFVIGGKDIAEKGYAVITCCEEEDDKVLDGVTMPLKRSADLIKWNLVGEVRVTGVLKVGDIDRTDGCKQAEALAEKI